MAEEVGEGKRRKIGAGEVSRTAARERETAREEERRRDSVGRTNGYRKGGAN